MINDAPISCGKCMYCRQKRISGWAARLMRKDMSSDMSFFVTLTYDPDHVMFCPKGRPTLYPNHLTEYWKALRKKIPPRSLSYYACGEYGSNRKRPHYHAIVFISDPDLLPMHALKYLETTWKHGEVFVGTVTGESVAYTLKYISKKGSVPEYAGDKRTPEFQRSSKGLGKEYLTPQMIEWHKADLVKRAYISGQGDIRIPMPRYFKDKIYTKEEKAQIGEFMQQNSTPRDYKTLKEYQKISTQKVNG